MSKSNTFFAHPFRKDGITHVVVTTKRNVRRGRNHRTVCGQLLDKDFQRLAPAIGREGLTPATCDGCVSSMTGLMEILERDQE